MMSIDEYERLKKFLDVFVARSALPRGLKPMDYPLAVLERLEVKSQSRARAGLKMAIDDCLSVATRMSASELAALDRALHDAGAPQTAELFVNYSRQLKKLLARGHIRTEAEYYLARNVADTNLPLTHDDLGRLTRIIDEYAG